MSNQTKPNYVPGLGSSSARIAIVGEAPGYEENEQGVPFVGQSGRLLNNLLREAGIDRAECYVTNVIKYQPPGNSLKRLSEIGVKLEEQESNLRVELITLSPNIIITLGNTALTSLTGKKGISKYRGSLLQGLYGGFKVLPTYHPASLLYNKDNKADKTGRETTIGGETIVIADLLKAKKNSLNREFDQVRRKLEICRNEYQLYQYLNSYPNTKEVALDIESNQSIPICIALAFNPYHSMSIPLLPLAGVGGGITLTTTEYINIWKTLSEFLNRPDIKFIGQNLKYDLEKLQEPCKILGYAKNKIAADTSLMMGVAYTEFPKNLAFMTSLLTNEPYYKDEGREFNPKKNKAEDLLTYNNKDSAVTYEIKQALDKELDEFSVIHKRDLKSFYYNYVNNLHDFYTDIEIEGLNVDLERRKELLVSYAAEIYSRQVSLNSLVGREFNIRSNPSIRSLFINELGLPDRPNYQEDTIVALLGNHCTPNSKEASILSLILELRQLKTNFNYLKSEPDPDGIMRTTYRITGTETGRTSTGVLKPPIRPIQTGLAFQTIPKHGPFSKAIRSIFIPPPGFIFLEVDLSQAEARIVAILADDDYTLKLFDTKDIHTETSKWIFGDNGDITTDQRFIGKTARHAGNYGMGKRRLMLDVNSSAKKYGLNIVLSEKKAGEIIDIFHTRTPKIRRVFQAEIKAQVGKDRTLFNPFGRMRQFFGVIKDEELYAQIPQSTVGDQIKLAGLRIKKRLPGIRICMEMHDALVFKLEENNWEEKAKIIKEELESPIDFKNCSLSRGKLIIPADLMIGTRFSELKKVKLN